MGECDSIGSNGVVHVINDVLKPRELQRPNPRRDSMDSFFRRIFDGFHLRHPRGAEDWAAVEETTSSKCPKFFLFVFHFDVIDSGSDRWIDRIFSASKKKYFFVQLIEFGA